MGQTSTKLAVMATLVLQNASAVYGNPYDTGAHLKARLLSQANVPVAGVEVLFLVDGVVVGSKSTDADGNAQLDYKLPDTMASGPHVLVAKLAPTSLTAPAATANLDVVKQQTALFFQTFQPQPFEVKDGKFVFQVFPNLTGKGGNPPKKAQLRVRFNGVEKTIDSAATANFDMLPKDYGKTSHVEIDFDGDAHYLPTSAQSQNIVIMTPQSALPDFQMGVMATSTTPLQLGQSVDILVSLSSGAGAFKAMPGVKVGAWGTNIDVPGGAQIDFGHATTDNTGRAYIHYTHNLPVPLGSYKLQSYMVFNGQNNSSTHTPLFGGDFKNASGAVQIAATPVDIVVTAPAMAKPGTAVDIHVQLLRKSDHQPAPGAIEIDGPSDAGGNFMLVSGPTDAQGHAHLSLPVGAHLEAGQANYTVHAHAAVGIGNAYGSIEAKKFSLELGPLR